MPTAEARPVDRVATLVHLLDSVPGRLTADELIGVVKGFAAAPELWRPLVQHIPSERWYRRLYSTERFEVWLLGWGAAQDTKIHDHGGSSGAFYVAEGALVEYYSDRRRRGPMLRDRHRRGESRAFGSSYVHNLVNHGPGLATSLHAYSPPLTRMGYYRRTEDERLELDCTLEVDGPEANFVGGL